MERLLIQVYGSLALTGEGHGTQKALVLGLHGHTPENVPVEHVPDLLDSVEGTGHIPLLHGQKRIKFCLEGDIRFEMRKRLPFHSNGIRFMALDRNADLLSYKHYYSIGGGFVVEEGEKLGCQAEGTVKLPFSSSEELLNQCRKHSLTIDKIALLNETSLRSEAEVKARLGRIWSIMNQSIQAGLASPQLVLPGSLHLPRRAKTLYTKATDPLDYLASFAMAVNEENAAGHRIVTAPTNGAAGSTLL